MLVRVLVPVSMSVLVLLLVLVPVSMSVIVLLLVFILVSVFMLSVLIFAEARLFVLILGLVFIC